MVLGLILVAATGAVVYRQQKKDPNSRLNRHKAKKAAKKNPQSHPQYQAQQPREFIENEEDYLRRVNTSMTIPPPYYDFRDEKEQRIQAGEVDVPEIPARSPARPQKY
ncbi:hypothetical protein F5884DRAFT_860986 [Xylogone sp. PMI_703]|nr:hypothetical protein F5884DRAFT_860986 [Xylogone sp. PMI_703]